MSNYKFGLKKLNEEARIEARIKSIFSLKPISAQKSCGLSPLTIEASSKPYELCLGPIGKHQTDCSGPWSIINTDIIRAPAAGETYNIIKQIDSHIEGCNMKYDALISLTIYTLDYSYRGDIQLGFIYQSNEIEIYIKYINIWPFYEDNLELDTWTIFYTLQNGNGETFECALILAVVD